MDLYALLGVARAASAVNRTGVPAHGAPVPPGRESRRPDGGGLVPPGPARVRDPGDAERRREYDRGGAAPPAHVATAVSVSLAGFDFHGAGRRAAGGDVCRTVRRRLSGSRARGDDAHARRRMWMRRWSCRSATPCAADRFRCRSCGRNVARSCAGDGRVSRPAVVCPACGGAGARRWVRGHMVFTRTCESCEGSGHLTVQPCRACAGVGMQPRSEVVTVTVPAGRRDGQPVGGARARSRRRPRRTGGRSLCDGRSRRRIRFSARGPRPAR